MTDQSAAPITMGKSTVMEEARPVLKVLSLLLDYPRERLIEARQELGDVINGFSHSVVKDKCGVFLEHLDATPLLQLQEEYARLFDFNPATCLNLTFHECGESKTRGFALVNLSQLYKNSGYEPATGELPDYLPLILEFLSVSSQETCSKILTQYGSHISDLA
ncbi:MAG: nitrate reductase molybdenum cofactor assembly chaperone, partial [Desulfomonilaceae bacterium]